MSELSEVTGLPVGTIKFYLRSGLLHAGTPVTATRSEYDDSHVERLRLVRALVEVGELKHTDIQRVLHAVDAGSDETSTGIRTIAETPARPAPDADPAPARALMTELGWNVTEDSGALRALAAALAALAQIHREPEPDRLLAYAEAALRVAVADVDSVVSAEPEERVLSAAAAALLWQPVLTSLRRLAWEHEQARRALPTAVRRAAYPAATSSARTSVGAAIGATARVPSPRNGPVRAH